MKNVAIWPYKMGSRSAAALGQALSIPQIKHKASKFRGARHKVVINWGSSETPVEVNKCKVLNPSPVVAVATNKLAFFRSLSERESIQRATEDSIPRSGVSEANISHSFCRLVPWTEAKLEALEWLKKGLTVVVRQSLTGHSGHGIIIVDGKETLDLPDAKLYTRYVPKDSEWRIHIMNGEVIFKQRKIKDPDIPEPKTWKIRSHDNGFIFQHNDLTVPQDVLDQAMLAYRGSGLNFGAVDVIFNSKSQKAFVLELNTACGLEGATIEAYANGFKKHYFSD